MAEPLTIVTKTALPVAEAGQAYSYTMQGLGGMPGYTWSLLSGAFPTGMSIDASGNITAAAGALLETESGTFTVTIRVTDTFPTSVDETLTIKLEPFNTRRTQLFQLDSRLTTLVQLLIDRGVSAEEITRHFFRALDGVIAGANLTHEDIDILVRTWPLSGSADVTLRDALDTLAAAIGGAETVTTLATPGASVTGVPDVIAIGASPTAGPESTLEVNGIVQVYTTDYTIAGTDLTYLNAVGRYTLNPSDVMILRYV